MRAAPFAIGFTGAALAGCGGASGERYVATANENLLVVVEDVVRGHGGAPSTATVHYILAAPQPLEEEQDGGRLVQRMTYKSQFDCDANAWGSGSRSYTFEDGGTVEATEPVAALQSAAPESVAGHIVATVCDPAISRAAGSRRSVEELEKRYRAAR